MDFLDELDELTAGTTAADVTGGRHPVGIYQGYVEEITQKSTRDGTKYWDLQIKTEAGRTWVKIFDITQDDYQQAKIDANKLESLKKNVARYKRFFVDLNVAPAETVNVWKWRELLYNIQYLKGKPCAVKVEISTKDPNQNITYLNAPAQQNPVSQVQAGFAQAPQQGYAPAPQQYTPASQSAQPPGAGVNLDQIPF